MPTRSHLLIIAQISRVSHCTNLADDMFKKWIMWIKMSKISTAASERHAVNISDKLDILGQSFIHT